MKSFRKAFEKLWWLFAILEIAAIPETFQWYKHQIHDNWKIIMNETVQAIGMFLITGILFLILYFLVKLSITKIMNRGKNKYSSDNSEYPIYIQSGNIISEITSDGQKHTFEPDELDMTIQMFYREFLAGRKLLNKKKQLIRWYLDTFSNAKWSSQAKEMLKDTLA